MSQHSMHTLACVLMTWPAKRRRLASANSESSCSRVPDGQVYRIKKWKSTLPVRTLATLYNLTPQSQQPVSQKAMSRRKYVPAECSLTFPACMFIHKHGRQMHRQVHTAAHTCACAYVYAHLKMRCKISSNPPAKGVNDFVCFTMLSATVLPLPIAQAHLSMPPTAFSSLSSNFHITARVVQS